MMVAVMLVMTEHLVEVWGFACSLLSKLARHEDMIFVCFSLLFAKHQVF